MHDEQHVLPGRVRLAGALVLRERELRVRRFVRAGHVCGSELRLGRVA